MDEIFLKVDEFFLGSLFPKGQISLYLDENKTFGPKSIGGKIINNSILFYILFKSLSIYICCIILELY